MPLLSSARTKALSGSEATGRLADEFVQCGSRENKKQKRHFLYLGFANPKSFNYASGTAAALWLKLTDGAEVLRAGL